MRLGAAQPYFFPYLGYFQLIAAVDKFVLYDQVNYIRQGWMHRNRLLEKGRRPIYCTVPLVHASSFVKIRDVRIDHTQRWREKLFDQLWFNYKKAGYFDEIYTLIERAVSIDTEYLAELNAATLTAVARYLDIATEISSDTSRYDAFEAPTSDEHTRVLRHYQESRGIMDIKTIRVLHLCACERAETYINAIGGQTLYDKELLRQNGVNLYFIQSTCSSYPQHADVFVPHLSIIDVLMHCGREGTRKRLGEYHLV